MKKWVLCLCLLTGVGLAAPGDPDLSNPVLIDGQIRHIDGSQILSILEDPFEDDSLVDHWIAVRRYEDLPIEYYRIVSNEHFDQWNISVFEVEENLGDGSEWWLYDEAFIFSIYAPEPVPFVVLSITSEGSGFYTALVDESFNVVVHVLASMDLVNWELIDVSEAEDGVIEFQDPDWDENVSRYYRIVISD